MGYRPHDPVIKPPKSYNGPTEGLNRLTLALWQFNHCAPSERYKHCRSVINMVWPKMKWHAWMEVQLEALCNPKGAGYDVVFAGCAAAGKTFVTSMFAIVWWLADPTRSSVLLTSTTKVSARKRLWASIQDLRRMASVELPGNMLDSQTMWQVDKQYDKSAIFVMAVADGPVEAAMSNIQGIHNKRVLVIVDEATDTPRAIFDVCANLSKGTTEFLRVAIGNPSSRLDAHGRAAKPKAGWDSVTVDTDDWETDTGWCYRFDGRKSPNITGGKDLWPYLFTIKDLQVSMDVDGEDSPKTWKYTYGFWVDDGMLPVVVTETLARTYSSQDTHIFTYKTSKVAALDPGFTGDRCILRFGRVGEIKDVKAPGLQLDEIISVPVSLKNALPVSHQISEFVIDQLEQRSIAPENFIIDATGQGAGVADIIAKDWSSRFRRLSFSEKPSSLPCSLMDKRPAHEAYKNKVTELWFSVRNFIQDKRLGGLDDQTLIEFTNRYYDEKERKICVEPKREMKMRTGYSPDLADAAAMLVELVRALFGDMAPDRGKDTDKQWSQFVTACNDVYA